MKGLKNKIKRIKDKMKRKKDIIITDYSPDCVFRVVTCLDVDGDIFYVQYFNGVIPVYINIKNMEIRFVLDDETKKE